MNKEVSRFGANFAQALIKPGTKVLDSTRAEIVAVSTKDKFTINTPARKIMGLKSGDRIAMFDDRALQNPVSTNMNDRFFVIPNYKNAAGQVIGSKIGAKNNTFSYSGVWSAIHMNNMDVIAAKPEDLAREGKAIITEYQMKDRDDQLQFDEKGRPVMSSSCIATQRVSFEVQPVLNAEGKNEHFIHFDENGEVIPIANEIYALVGMEITSHDPRTDAENIDDDINEEGDETVEAEYED